MYECWWVEVSGLKRGKKIKYFQRRAVLVRVIIGWENSTENPAENDDHISVNSDVLRDIAFPSHVTVQGKVQRKQSLVYQLEKLSSGKCRSFRELATVLKMGPGTKGG